MPRLRVRPHGDVGQSGRAVPVGQRGQQRQLAVDGVALAGRDVDGKVSPHGGQLPGVGEPPCAGEHGLGRAGVEAKPAPRVADVGIHDRLVTGQPVVVSTGRLERGVEHGQVQRLIQVQCGFEQVDHGRAGQDDSIGVRAVIQQVLLHRERPHAVPQQDQRQARLLGPDLRGQQADVRDQRGPPALPQVTQHALADGRAVAPVVLRVDDQATAVHGLGEGLITKGVLAHAVRDLHRGTRHRRGIPAVRGYLLTVSCGVTESARRHGLPFPGTSGPGIRRCARPGTR